MSRGDDQLNTRECYFNEHLLPSTDDSLLKLTDLRQKGPQTCLKSMRICREAIFTSLNEADIDLCSSKFSKNDDNVKNIDTNTIKLLDNLTDQLKNSNEQNSSQVISDYKNVLKFISTQKK